MTEDTERKIITRELDTDIEEPALQIAEIVAEVEEKDVSEMKTMYDVTDHIVDELFSRPPGPEAQFDISFSYEGYRISVNQNGALELVDTATS